MMSLQCLTIIATSIVILNAQSPNNYFIYSPRVTNWGNWGDFVYCPPGQYVNGMRLKVEPIRKTGVFGYSDNTALNGIELYCGEFGKPRDHQNGTMIFTDQGRFGDWGSKLFCPENTFVTGFQLRSADPRGANFIAWILGMNGNDDTAANNLRIFCSERQYHMEGYGTYEGYWSQSQHCLERQAVCGYRTQLEPYQVTGDDTMLNNVDMVCCDVPDPLKNCVPEETWDVVKECDNTQGVTDLNCHYQKKVGVGYSKVATKADAETYGKIGYNTKSVGPTLVSKFADLKPVKSIALDSGNIWSSSTFEITSEETIHGLTFAVPPGYKTELLQVVGICGVFSVRTPKFIRSDTNVLNQTVLKEIELNTTAYSVQS